MYISFSNPLITLKGKSTIMRINATLVHNNINIYTHDFHRKITLKDNDTYDLNKARNILQAQIEHDAYSYFNKMINKQIKQYQKDLLVLNKFSLNAEHIIKHDKEYLEKIK